MASPSDGPSVVRDGSQHEPGAASKAPAGHDRREAPGRAARDHDFQVVGLAELRNQRGVGLRVWKFAQYVLGQSVAAIAAGYELAHGALQAVPEELSDTRLVPAVVADDPSVLGTQDDERVSPVGHLVALDDRQAARDSGKHVR